ncbi:hypothetical protein PIB30_082129, partial [Stylosanthes scabra]|nr:hypothetical protein [Stylosanthes scabra]
MLKWSSLFGGKVLHVSASGALSPFASGQSAESKLVYLEARVHGVCALHIVSLDGGQRLHEFPHFDRDFDF